MNKTMRRKRKVRACLNEIINPLSPKSDHHQFSLNNINTQSGEKVTRINNMITRRKNVLIPFTLLLRKYIEISLANLV